MVEEVKRSDNHLSFTSSRRFGVELELNSFDGESRPPNGKKNPEGIDYIANLVAKHSPEEGCEVRGYEHTSNNSCWVAKMDSSCGLEIVSPAFKGWHDLKKVLQVVSAFAKDPKIKADSRCSVHIHVETKDLSQAEIASVISWWVKCEPVILDAMPMDRKRNRYCQMVGMNNMFQHNMAYNDQDVINLVGDVKYYSMNTHQMCQNGRPTIEFRTIEGGGSKDAYLVKQWVRFIIHFVEMTAKLGRPATYHDAKNDDEKKNLTPWTGLAWLDPEHVLTLLGFNNCSVGIPNLRPAQEHSLSNGLQQTRDWFLARLVKFMSRHKPGGLRHYAYKQLEEVLAREQALGRHFDANEHLSPSEMLEERLFGDQYRI